MSNLVIVMGPSASGKSTLVKQLEADFNIPIICKDDFKEILFDTVGIGDVSFSEKQGAASFELLFLVLSQFAKNSKTVVVEANFKQRHAKKLAGLGFENIHQVLVSGDPEVLKKRFIARLKKDRHPGHADDQRNTDGFVAMVQEWSKILDIPGDKIRLDSTNGEELYAPLHDLVKKVSSNA